MLRYTGFNKFIESWSHEYGDLHTLCIQFGLIGLAYWWFKRKISKIEMCVVRQVMEESPQLVDHIVQIQHKLVQSGMSPLMALTESRRLHGMDP